MPTNKQTNMPERKKAVEEIKVAYVRLKLEVITQKEQNAKIKVAM